MRILKEYKAFTQETPLDDKNSVEMDLTKRNQERAVQFIVTELKKIDVSDKILRLLTGVTEEVYHTLAISAGARETVRLALTYHKYYYRLVFEFAESALPIQTLNKSIKFLSVGREQEDEAGFHNLVHLVERIGLSVDKVAETMRLSIIKEKNYRVPNRNEKLPPIDDKRDFQIVKEDYELAYDFSTRLFQTYGHSADDFLVIPEKFIDNLKEGELEARFLKDGNGRCAGGFVWQKTYGTVVVMVITTFTESIHASNTLFDAFKEEAKAMDANFLISKIGQSTLIADYFDHHDEKYHYKFLDKEKTLTSHVKSDLLPFVKKAYSEFGLKRKIHEIKHDYRFYESYSVLTVKVDQATSEAVLSILWSGDDLKANILRHIAALQRIGVKSIYFRLNLGDPDEAMVSDLIGSCGFEAKYLWPYSGEMSDTVVFTYSAIMAYEIKPCEVFPINKENIRKVPELVRRIYGENYSAHYLYQPERLWEKIRKRHLYSYVAIDDEGKAMGMIGFLRMSGNPYLYEIGQLMVDPKHRGTNVASQLIEYVYDTAMERLDFDAVFSESVTNHKFSQRSCISSGFQDTGLRLNIMSEEAFALESEKRRIGRMSCVVSCMEWAEEDFLVYVPKTYQEQVELCYEGLKPRTYRISTNEAPEDDSVTEYRMNEDELPTSRLLEVTIFHVGFDIYSVIDKIERYVSGKDVKCVLVNIPLKDAYNETAVQAFKKNGFIFSGVTPYWLPESDALVMQKLYGNVPEWDSIKLYSRKIKEIAKWIREEMEEGNGIASNT